MSISKQTIETWHKAVEYLDKFDQERTFVDIDYNRGSNGRWINMIVQRDYPYELGTPTQRFCWYDGSSYQGTFERNIIDLFPKKPDEVSGESS